MLGYFLGLFLTTTVAISEPASSNSTLNNNEVIVSQQLEPAGAKAEPPK